MSFGPSRKTARLRVLLLPLLVLGDLVVVDLLRLVPRNTASRRVAEKLKLRDEGTAERYLEINGTWEDHIRFAMTAEEWEARSEDLIAEWIGF